MNKTVQVKEPSSTLSFASEAKKVEDQLLYLDLLWIDASLLPLKLPQVPQITFNEDIIIRNTISLPIITYRSTAPIKSKETLFS
jgi:hypothetical protein